MASANQERVGPYRLVNLLRKGQVCEIWEVCVEGQDQPRQAMKFLPRGSRYTKEQVAFLKHEYAIGKRFKHPHIIETHEFTNAKEGTYILMELFRAPNLKQRIHEGPESYIYNVERIIRGAAEGLGYMHRKGYVHRDVKPDNFLVDDQGDVRLIDFNLVIRKQGLLSRLVPGRGKVQGTMSYMSPEQIRGQAVDARADIYSFGCVLHELLSGKPPYTGASVQDLLTKHLRSGVPSLEPLNSNVHVTFAKLVQRMMAKNPAQRPATMEKFLDELTLAQIFREKPKPPAADPAKKAT